MTEGSLLPRSHCDLSAQGNDEGWTGLPGFTELVYKHSVDPPSVHSALMLGHARNVHTYGYKHKHSGMAWKLVAGYLTFLTSKTLAKFGDTKKQHWLFVQMPQMTYVYDSLRRTSCGRANYDCCLSEAKVEAAWCCQSTAREEVWMDCWVTPETAVCIPFYYQLSALFLSWPWSSTKLNHLVFFYPNHYMFLTLVKPCF